MTSLSPPRRPCVRSSRRARRSAPASRLKFAQSRSEPEQHRTAERLGARHAANYPEQHHAAGERHRTERQEQIVRGDDRIRPPSLRIEREPHDLHRLVVRDLLFSVLEGGDVLATLLPVVTRFDDLTQTRSRVEHAGDDDAENECRRDEEEFSVESHTEWTGTAPPRSRTARGAGSGHPERSEGSLSHRSLSGRLHGT